MIGRYAGALRRRVGRALFDNGAVRSSEWALRGRLRWAGARRRPRAPRRGWMNSALRSHQQVAEALAEVNYCGLPSHRDAPKNWDALSGLKTILDHTTPEASVLEAGAALYSVTLPWLYLYGYRKLWGIDLVFDKPEVRGPICYEPGDLTATRFADGAFDAVACLSVIEHGVDLRQYFAEMSRILRPGGVLITSADYWDQGVDTRGQTAYGVPIKVFTKEDVQGMLAIAHRNGLTLDGPLDVKCGERVVHWKKYNLQFTFCCFCVTKGENSCD